MENIFEERLEVIEPILNFQKVRYTKLNELIPLEYARGKRVNIYINLNSILNYFYSENIISSMNSLQGSEYLIFVPEFINLMAHYRHYFWSKFGTRTRFFIYYLNEPVKKAKHINKKYCKKYIDRLDSLDIKTGVMNDILKTIFKMIDRIILYVPECYFLNSSGNDLSVIPYYIIKRLNKVKNHQAHIVLTHDYYDYQMLNLKDTMILSPAGNKSKSYFLKNIYDKKKKNCKYELENDINPELFSLLLSISGYKDRNIEKIQGFAKTIKKLDSLISTGILENEYTTDIKNVSELLNIDYDTLYNNFLLTDLRVQEKSLTKANKQFIGNKLINLRDNTTLMNLNSDYFQFNNLQLIELCEGED